MSAPVNPVVHLANFSALILRVKIRPKYKFRISLRPEKSGAFTVISESKRPGLNNALSRS